MEPQILIASLYEHFPKSTTGQHDLIPADNGTKFDTVGVLIALVAMVGIMLAMAMLGGSDGAVAPSASMSHLMMSTR